VQIPDKSLPYIPNTPEDFLGKRLNKIFPKEILKITLEKLAQVRKTKSLVRYNLPLTLNEKPYFFETRLFPFEKNQVIVLISDVSKMRRLSKELIQAKDQAIESNKKINQFLANISTELRAPMNAILGFSALLERENLSEGKKQEYIDQIKTKGQTLVDLIDDIINVTNIESQKLSIIKNNFDVNILLKDLLYKYVAELERQNKHTRLNIECLPLPEGQEIIHSDAGRIEQVLTTLLNNALKFTNKGSIVFGVEYKLKDNMFRFFVKDTGEGIPDNLKEHLFTKFSNSIDNDTSFNYTGLGLRISKGIVNLLGGDIWFESDPQKGTRFYFTIPSVVENRSQNNVLKTINETNWKGKRILIVEDEEVNSLLLTEFLYETQIDIVHAKNGQEFINHCKEIETFDAVLMDIRLPDNNGIELTKYAKSLRNNIPIIAQTAYAMEQGKNHFIDEGFDDIVLKPIDFYELFRILNRHIG